MCNRVVYLSRISVLSFLAFFLIIPKAYCYRGVSNKYAFDRTKLISSSLDDVERRKARIDYTKKPVRSSYPYSVNAIGRKAYLPYITV